MFKQFDKRDTTAINGSTPGIIRSSPMKVPSRDEEVGRSVSSRRLTHRSNSGSQDSSSDVYACVGIGVSDVCIIQQHLTSIQSDALFRI